MLAMQKQALQARPSMARRAPSSVVVRATAQPAKRAVAKAAAAGDSNTTTAPRTALLGTAALVAPFLLVRDCRSMRAREDQGSILPMGNGAGHWAEREGPAHGSRGRCCDAPTPTPTPPTSALARSPAPPPLSHQLPSAARDRSQGLKSRCPHSHLDDQFNHTIKQQQQNKTNKKTSAKQETSAALAKDGEFGSLLEGRFVALAHPAVMGALFLYTGYAGWLGWQWRRTRTIGDDIKALKATAPKPAAAAEGAPAAPPSPVEQQITALEAVSLGVLYVCSSGGMGAEKGIRIPSFFRAVSSPPPPKNAHTTPSTPKKKTKKPKKKQERKELVQGGFRDKHFNAGSILLAGGVIIAIEGCLNTYMRTGRLFPGPHLFAGAGIVALWAAAAALVPAMQKGNEGARSAHIALNAVNLALFAWQVPTGLEIVGKVFQFVPKWF
jgi:hypothetical protein